MADLSQAEHYESVCLSNISYQDGVKMIELLALQRGDKVLDVGCGTGYLTKMLADLVGPEGKVVGVDPDVERLKIARDKYPASNLEYLEGTAENIPGTNSTYDIIFSNYVLHWCEDKMAVLKEITPKLKPGGKFGIVGFGGYIGGVGPKELFSDNFFTVLNKSFHPFDDTFCQLVESTNSFTVTVFKKRVASVNLKDVSELVKHCMTHLLGRVNEDDFDIEAMKCHFGEGEVSRPIQLYDIILTKSQKP